MHALVHRGRVVQKEDEPFPVHPSLTWHDLTGVSPEPEIGWTFDGQNFTAPPVQEETQEQRDRRELRGLERAVPGALEDLIDTLVSKGAIVESELPPRTLAALSRKRVLRGRLGGV